ncbi:hypothetical protein VDGD_09075 [Verticillium dahliae]|nr:hypothetical protein VdG1_07950 [Verticillium dahliae VDG1]RBQ96818.1 hypothetical protein VDGD_09075 [Verticillium dahliae]
MVNNSRKFAFEEELSPTSQNTWQAVAQGSSGPNYEPEPGSPAGPSINSSASNRQSGGSLANRWKSRNSGSINTSPQVSAPGSPVSTPLSARRPGPLQAVYSGLSGKTFNRPNFQQQPSHCMDKRDSMLFTAVTKTSMASNFNDEQPETLDLINDALMKTVARTTVCLAEMEVRVGLRTLLACQAVQGLANLRQDVASGKLMGPALTQRLYREQSEVLDRLESIRDAMRNCSAHEPICECQLSVSDSMTDQYTTMDFFAGRDIHDYAECCHNIVLESSDAKNPATEAKIMQKMYRGLDEFFKRKDQAGFGDYEPEKGRCQNYESFFEAWYRMISPDNKPFLNKLDQEMRRLQALADQQRKKKVHKKRPEFIRRVTGLLKGKSVDRSSGSGSFSP